MSGFEVAGIVLGALPILVSSLEYYRRIHQPLFRYGESMKDLICSLRNEQAQFRRTWHILLYGLIDDAELVRLLDEPQQDVWKVALREGLERKLRRRLGKDHEIFQDYVFRIASDLQTLSHIVGIDSPQPARAMSAGSKEHREAKSIEKEIWKRIKHCVSQSSYKALLDRLEKANLGLKGLVKDCIELEPYKVKQHQVFGTKEILHWKSLHSCSLNLYEALLPKWLCDDGHSHRAFLRIDERASDHAMKFFILFLTSPTKTKRDCQWKPTEIETLENDEDEAIPSHGVRFQQKTPRSTQHTNLPDREIKCVCAELSNAKSETCLGFLTEKQIRHYIHARPDPTLQQANSTTSLYDILDQKCPTTRLYVRDKYELAVRLATLVLQFHKTPWLPERWTSRDILFIGINRETGLAQKSYISTVFASQCPNDPATVDRGVRLPRKFIRNETLFSLGLALIELSIGMPLDSQAKAEELDENGEMTEYTDIQIGERMIEEMRNRVNELEEYIDIAKKCIWPSVLKTGNLDEKVTRGQYIEHILSPLMDLADCLPKIA